MLVGGQDDIVEKYSSAMRVPAPRKEIIFRHPCLYVRSNHHPKWVLLAFVSFVHGTQAGSATP